MCPGLDRRSATGNIVGDCLLDQTRLGQRIEVVPPEDHGIDHGEVVESVGVVPVTVQALLLSLFLAEGQKSREDIGIRWNWQVADRAFNAGEVSFRERATNSAPR